MWNVHSPNLLPISLTGSIIELEGTSVKCDKSLLTY